MNGKQIVILISGLVILAFIVWYDLPIQFPWAINLFKLCVKLSILAILCVVSFIFAGGRKKP
jgi:hypothetical protein